jgi:hypothetical protein
MSERQVILEGAVIRIQREIFDGGQGFQLGPEENASAVMMPVQRFDANAITGDKQSVFAGVPHGEGEHAIELVEEVFALFFVQVDEDFGIATGAEAMASTAEALSEFVMVINFAVKAHPDCAVFVAHRLTAGVEVDDTQAGVADTGLGIVIEAGIVGAAVR